MLDVLQETIAAELKVEGKILPTKIPAHSSNQKKKVVQKSAGRNPRNASTSNCLVVHRKGVDYSHSSHCKTLGSHTGSIYSIEFSSDGSLLASGGSDKMVRLWSTENVLSEAEGNTSPSEQITSFENRHANTIMCMAFSPNNSRLITGAWDGKILIHDVTT